ncbi:hypothetical protein CPC16_007543 [Podila verticillata]|nr:hypothetical protein BGZ59_002996 [Podila verticillata]KAF9386452.1 hypothetical protein CPC16_007543 [Podila verticillata]KAI9233515.1 MAG: coth protein-domain-containing protein [Podila humilis]KFH66732.1 hypothetical protein MVEG_07257 [Podila verticillata NRRL 6337]
MVRLLLGLAACAAYVLADVTFNVVGLRDSDGDMFGVSINGKVTKLTTTEETYPLWSANVAGVNGPLKYKYVQLSAAGKTAKEEKAERNLPAGAIYTPNEFFGRTQTIRTLPPLPQVFENKLEQNSPFFREGFIGNIFVEGDPAKIAYINKGGAGFDPEPFKVKIHYIGANDNIKIDDVSFGLSGASTREYSKLAYRLEFPKKDRLLDLSTLKLRSGETDATMMREKLYIDILNSIGVPTQQSAYVRLFFNNKPVGLYVANEEMKKHWIKRVLHPGVIKIKPGALWKMDSCCGRESNLEWLGPTTKSYVIGDIYKNILPGNNPKDDVMKDLIDFMKILKDYDPKKVADPIAFWNKHLNLDIFLKSMAMEYLTGSWDSYWYSGSNYQFYNDPVTGQWTWLPTDFDDTFGVSFKGKIESYRAIPKKNDQGFESPLAQKLIIETPQINARFEQILKDIVSYVFKPSALTPRLDAYKKMIQEDVAWDRVQPRLSKGKSGNFTIEDLTKGLGQGTKGNWGLGNWIEKRSTIIQKDMKFRVLAGAPNKVDPHVITRLQSAYGISAPKPNVEDTSPSTENYSEGDKKYDTVDDDNEPSEGKQSDVEAQGDKKNIVNSAQVIKGKWAALGTVVAAAALAL